LCRQVVLCAPDGSAANLDPFTNPASNLSTTTFNPAAEFTAPADAASVYPPDPACPSPPCNLGPSNGWCTYMTPQALTHQNAADSKNGASGSGDLIEFDFVPNLSLTFDSTAHAFGVSDFQVAATASFLASTTFQIPTWRPWGPIEVLNLTAAFKATPCRAWTSDSKFQVFGIDWLPILLTPDQFDYDTDPKVLSASACEAAFAQFDVVVNRAQKAMKDAEALLTQYNSLKAAGSVFPANLCEQVAADPPLGFPPGNCATETPEATINRFVDFANSQIDTAFNQVSALASQELALHKNINLDNQGTQEQQTLFAATFFVGPIPVTADIQFAEAYGVTGDVNFDLYPGQITGAGAGELGGLGSNVTPYANGSVGLYMGVGFNIGIASASAGFEGYVTLGDLDVPAVVGASINMAPVPDTRPLPADLAALNLNLSGSAPMHQYQFSLGYNYGLSVDLNDVMGGYLAAWVDVSFLFYSESWSSTIVDFGPGFSLSNNVLIQGSSAGAAALGSFPWATLQMPSPLVTFTHLVAPLNPITEADGGPAPVVNFDTSQVEKLFYDSLCVCEDAGAECYRAADCCAAGSICFSDPTVGGPKVCSSCRTQLSSCNTTSDCCAGAGICYPSSDSTPTAPGACQTCLDIGRTCNNTPLECCSPGYSETLPDGGCECHYNPH
jgi:hypothetical protein